MNIPINLAVICLYLLFSAKATFAVTYDYFNDPELRMVMENIFGDFDYETSTVDDCRQPLQKFKNAISKEVFKKSNLYLAQAYMHQGNLMLCVAQDPAISEVETLELAESALESFKQAQQRAPDWDLPYYMLANYYNNMAFVYDPNDYFTKAEQYLIKALEIAPDNELYQSLLNEVKPNVPIKQSPDFQTNKKTDSGFEPIPFE